MEQDATTPEPISTPPAASLEMPPLTPERANVRRVKGGPLFAGLGLCVALGTLAPAAVIFFMLPREAQAPVAGATASLANVGKDAAAIRDAMAQSQQEVRALAEPAFAMARLEAKRAAVRGGILVEQEARRIHQEQQHQIALEAALARNPGLAATANKLPPVAPALLEPFIKRVGLQSPLESGEGEVVLQADGTVLGGVMPTAFSKLLEAVQDNHAELDGRAAYKAAVPGLPLFVLAVRRMPVAKEPVALAQVSDKLARMEIAAASVPGMLEAAAAEHSQLQDHVHEASIWALALGVVCALLAAWLFQRTVATPLRALRTELERVRGGQRPLTDGVPGALQDTYASLLDLAERLLASKAQAEERATRQATLESVIHACERAQAGDFTARPETGDGMEGMASLAVAGLLDNVEQRLVRNRALAQSLGQDLQALENAPGGTLSADAQGAVDALKQRIDLVATVPGLLKSVTTRLEMLAASPGAVAVADDVRRLAQAVSPRAAALNTVLEELQAALARLPSQVGAAPSQEALQRARANAQELSREARAAVVGQTFPAVVAALRDLPMVELQRAVDGGSQPV